MRLRIFIATSIVFAALIATAVDAQTAKADTPVMVPGLWEITVQTRTPILGPLLTHRVCIDATHVARPEPPRSRPSDDCQVSPAAAAANETAYTVRCAKRNMTSSSRFTYSGDHFNGTVDITNVDGQIHQVYTATRISDCDGPLPETNPAPPAPGQ